MQIPEGTGKRVHDLLTSLDAIEDRYEADVAVEEITRDVIGALLAIPRSVRTDLGLGYLVSQRLDKWYNTEGYRLYPKLAPDWACGPTAVLDAVDRLTAAALAADYFYILDTLDEIYLLVGSGLAAGCSVHSPAGQHGRETAA